MATRLQQKSSVNSMIAEMHKAKKPLIELIGFEPLANEGFARVTASVTHTSESRKDSSVVIASLQESMKNKMHPIEGSFSVLSSGKVAEVITGIVSSNPETIAYSKDMANFRALSGNMFMDEEEQLWTLRKTEAGDLLVRSRGREDADVMQELMSSLSSVQLGTPAYESLSSSAQDSEVRQGLTGGDFVSFVEPSSETVMMGVIIASVESEEGDDAGVLVLASDDGASPVQIDRNLVVASFADVDIDMTDIIEEGEQEAVAANGLTLDQIAAYYSRVFQRDPAYFEQFMARWKSHVFA